MVAEWQRLSRSAGLHVVGNSIEIVFKDQRRQQLNVEVDAGGSIRLWTIIAWPAQVRQLSDPYLTAWYRNRSSELVGFRLERDRMIGESWVPPDPLTADEWSFQVLAVAEACDRLQYLLTGRDDS
jgi:hypothetical protein